MSAPEWIGLSSLSDAELAALAERALEEQRRRRVAKQPGDERRRARLRDRRPDLTYGRLVA